MASKSAYVKNAVEVPFVNMASKSAYVKIVEVVKFASIAASSKRVESAGAVPFANMAKGRRNVQSAEVETCVSQGMNHTPLDVRKQATANMVDSVLTVLLTCFQMIPKPQQFTENQKS